MNLQERYQENARQIMELSRENARKGSKEAKGEVKIVGEDRVAEDLEDGEIKEE